jgi:hypothetical protein
VSENGGRILYCDTDSIFAAFNKNNLPLDKHHGEVYWDSKKPDTILDDACFATSKVYCAVYDNASIVKIKGVSSKYIEDFDIEKFRLCFLKKQTRKFKTLNFEKIKLDIKIVELNKIIDFSFYDKRIFNSSKTKTTALVLEKFFRSN